MTQEDKELLLKDLCARLPYGVIVKDRNGVHKLMPSITEFIDLFTEKINITPYLRPMSSMTEEEWNDYKSTWKLIEHDLEDTYEPCIESFDWLNAHHFDYRGLIEKGLAIDVTKKKTKKNNPYV